MVAPELGIGSGAPAAGDSGARPPAKGSWATGANGPFDARDVPMTESRYVLVEGRIARAAPTSIYWYANFGELYRRDFTVRIPKMEERAFIAAGLDLAGLGGRRVRVRGWLFEENGPMIEITHPLALEVLKSSGVPWRRSYWLPRWRCGAGGLPTALAQERGNSIFMSPAQEAEIGREQHEQVLAQFVGGLYGDTKLQQYVTGIGDRLKNVTPLKDQKFTFSLLNSDVVNAFALPGGYVYVTRGLLALARDEAEFAGVLGHESVTSSPATPLSATTAMSGASSARWERRCWAGCSAVM